MPRSNASTGAGGVRTPSAPAARRRFRRADGLLTDAVMIGPALLLVALFVLIPIGIAAYLSFTNWDGFTIPPSWVGIRNYERLFQDPDAVRAATYTAVIAVVG